MKVERAAPSDIEGLIDVHLSAFAGQTNFTMHLGRGFMRKTYAWLVEGDDRFTFVAREGERIVGHVAGTYRRPLSDMQRGRLATLAMALLVRPHLLLHSSVRSPLIGRLLQKRKNEETYLNCSDYAIIYIIAVHPNFHGRGIAGQMASALETEARERGIATLFVPVGEDNVHSLSAFRKAGFSLLPGVLSDGNVILRRDIVPT